MNHPDLFNGNGYNSLVRKWNKVITKKNRRIHPCIMNMDLKRLRRWQKIKKTEMKTGQMDLFI